VVGKNSMHRWLTVLRIGYVCLVAAVYRLKKRPGDRSCFGGDGSP
jgi:hypothetical protein